MRLIAFLGRIALAVVACAILAMVGLQYARAIQRNVAVARALDASHAEVARLQARKAEQLRIIKRLRDPSGAIPEIHDRLHLVGPREAIIYLRGGPTAAPIP